MMSKFLDHNNSPLTLRSDYLLLTRCPHCSTASPTVEAWDREIVKEGPKGSQRHWRLYFCKSCGGAIVGCSKHTHHFVTELYPSLLRDLSWHIPANAKQHLAEARDITSQPSACIMSCANAINAMLIAKKVEGGNLYPRLKNAQDAGILSKEVALWGHQVRLDANEERHPDEEYTPPTVDDAKQALEFTLMLAEILFVIPAKVNEGVRASKELN